MFADYSLRHMENVAQENLYLTGKDQERDSFSLSFFVTHSPAHQLFNLVTWILMRFNIITLYKEKRKKKNEL